MPRAQSSRSRRPTPSPSPTPERNRRTAAENVISKTLTTLEIAVDKLQIPNLQVAAEGVLELIKIADNAKQNTGGLFELYIQLRRLESSVIAPLLSQHHLRTSPALQGPIDRLASELDQLGKDWQKLKTSQNPFLSLLENEDYDMAISDINVRIKESMDVFLLSSQVTESTVVETTQRVVVPKNDHILSKKVQALPYAAASFDSISRNNAPVCFENTRVLVLDNILGWIMNDGRRIYILNGIAGVGKTTIAQTIATLAANNNCLFASFFFSRYEDGRNTSRIFFTTIAYQLAKFSPKYDVQISDVLMRSPDIPQKNLAEQMKKLLVGPLQEVCIPDGRPIVMVLDALDECVEAERAEILQLLLDGMSQLPQSVKLFITMRPEPQFFPILDPSSSHELFILHDIDQMIVSEDIQRYLQHQLSPAEVQKVIYGCKWQIGPKDLESLVQLAGRLFIVASTAERFIKDPKKRNPARQLEIVLGKIDVEGSSNRSPFAALDRLYLQILEAAIDDQEDRHIVRVFQNVVGTIITLEDPLPTQTLTTLVGEDAADVDALLDLLQSVIVPTREAPCPRVYHPSFPDFITNLNRCSNKTFLIDTRNHHALLAERCLDTMGQYLKKNICDLPIPERYMMNHEIPNLAIIIKQHIPAELEYASTYWAVHLSKAASSDELMRKVEVFTLKYLLFWLEALSLMGRFDHAYPALELAEKFSASVHAPKELLTVLSDAQRFVMGSYAMMKQSALHVYYSALPFAPRESSLFLMYEHEASESIEVLQGRDMSWNPLLAVLVGHSSSVNSAVFSPNGTYLASASDDNTVRLWNGVTGAEVAELKGHSSSVNSVVFSPDGTRLASASSDRTVQIWNWMTRTPIAALKGHSGPVNLVVFSPDGIRIASASSDKTVRLWNGLNGATITRLSGHSSFVNSVIFSPDGTRLASTSADKTVRLWNGVDGAIITKMSGNSSLVSSAAFSPDGTRLATASSDNTVWMWDGVTGARVAKLKGHSSSFKSVVFSPSGSLLASASSDRTMHLWNVVNGAVVARLKGHSGPITSIAFSPEGTLLASASKDETVRVWNTVTGSEVAELRSHSSLVNSIVFSPDGTRLASSSSDRTVRLWSGVFGSVVASLGGSANSIVFSPDGTHFVSPSEDHTMLLWDAATRTVVANLGALVKRVTFSPDGRHFASVSEGDNTLLWNAATRTVVANLGALVKRVTFSPDGRHFVSVTEDDTMLLWNTATGAAVANIRVFVRGAMLSQARSRSFDWARFPSDGIHPLSTDSYKRSLRNVLTSTFIEAIANSPPDGIRLAPGSSDLPHRLTLEHKLATQSPKGIQSCAHPNSCIHIESVVLEFDQDASCYVVSGLCGKADQTFTKIRLCWLPPGLHQAETTRVLGGCAVLGFPGNRTVVLSIARLKLAKAAQEAQ